MNIDLYYFSGTGNTAWMVRRLTEHLHQLGDEVRARSCEQIATATVDPANCDLLGLAFPVSSSFAPPPFQEFIQGLPPGKDNPLFAITSAGYWAGDTAWYAVQPLQARGYWPFLLGSVVIANNFCLPPMDFLPVTPPEKLPRKLERAERKITRLAQYIHRCEPHTEGIDPLGRLLGIIQRWSFAAFEKRLFQPFFADENCIHCGWCVRHCPVQNITQTEEGIHFQERCVLCMRCYSHCPQQAIQASPKTRNLRRYRRYKGPDGKRYPGNGLNKESRV